MYLVSPIAMQSNTFFDECPAHSKDETTACSLHMSWDLDLSKTAVAIATTECVDSKRQELAAAFNTASNAGAFAPNSEYPLD